MADQQDRVTCSRCDTEVHIDDAVELTRQGNKDLLKVLCPACLRAVGVPQGYKIDRDLSYRDR